VIPRLRDSARKAQDVALVSTAAATCSSVRRSPRLRSLNSNTRALVCTRAGAAPRRRSPFKWERSWSDNWTADLVDILPDTRSAPSIHNKLD
jgi:hypothetical protein